MEKQAPRGVSVHTFKERLQQHEVFFYVLRMQQSFLLWVGTEQIGLQTLAVAMNTPHVSASWTYSMYTHPRVGSCSSSLAGHSTSLLTALGY